MATGVANVTCCQPVALLVGEGGGGQAHAAGGPQAAGVGAGVAGALVEADASDGPRDVGTELHASSTAEAVGDGGRPGTSEPLQMLHGQTPAAAAVVKGPRVGGGHGVAGGVLHALTVAV